jgi:integrase
MRYAASQNTNNSGIYRELPCILRRLADMIDSMAPPPEMLGVKKPLAPMLEQWGKDLAMRGGVGADQVKRSRWILAQVAEFCGWSTVEDLSNAGVLEYLNTITQQGLSNQTARNRLGAVRSFGQYLVETEVWETNRFALIRLPKQRRKPKGSEPLTLDEVRRLIDTARSGKFIDANRKRFALMRANLYMFLVLTGLRKKEARLQRWEDIDLGRRAMLVTADKAGRGDTIPLPNEAVALLRELRAAASKDEPLVFPVWPDHNSLLRDMAKAGVKGPREGVPGIWHRFRKCAITERAKAGADIVALQKFSRHTDPHVTLDTYVHLRTEDMRETADRITILDKKCELGARHSRQSLYTDRGTSGQVENDSNRGSNPRGVIQDLLTQLGKALLKASRTGASHGTRDYGQQAPGRNAERRSGRDG